MTKPQPQGVVTVSEARPKPIFGDKIPHWMAIGATLMEEKDTETGTTRPFYFELKNGQPEKVYLDSAEIK